MIDRQLFTNNAQTTLAANATAGETSMTVTDGSVFSSPSVSGGTFELLTLANAAGVTEIIKLLSRSGNALTVERGQEGDTPQIWGTGTTIYARTTAGTYGKLQAPYTTDSDLLATLLKDFHPVLLQTSVLDLTQVAADDIWTITLPSGVYFFPDEVFAAGSDQNTISVQPELEIGITGDPDAICTQEALTIVAPNDDRNVLTLVAAITNSGMQSLTVSLKVAAVATAYDAVVCFSGMLRDIN